MASDDDTLLRSGRVRPPSSIADLLGKQAVEAEEEQADPGEAAALDKLTPLPGPGDPYKA